MVLRPKRMRLLPGLWTLGRGRAKAQGRTPALLRTPARYVQPLPWLAIANKNLELLAQVHDRTRPVAGLAQQGFRTAAHTQTLGGRRG